MNTLYVKKKSRKLYLQIIKGKNPLPQQLAIVIVNTKPVYIMYIVIVYTKPVKNSFIAFKFVLIFNFDVSSDIET